MALQVMLLDVFGVIAAIVVGAAVYYLGGAAGIDYLVMMFVFLFAGTIVTMMGKNKKEKMGLYEYGRSWQNVFSNGLVPVACIALGQPAAYLGSLAAITSDKFSSEIGTLGTDPIFLGDLKKCKRGTSGAVTVLGTTASFVGAGIIGLSAAIVFPQEIGIKKAVALTLIGAFGSFADTLAGILETRGFGNKSTSNLIGALSGAALGYIAFLLI